MERPHSQYTSDEVNAKQAEYQALDNRIRGSAFNAKVPTREDAMKKIQEKKREEATIKHSTSKIISASHTTIDPPIHTGAKREVKKANKKSQSTTQSTTSSTKHNKKRPSPKKSKKKTTKKKSKTRQPHIQMPMKVFIALVIVIAVLAGALIAQAVLSRRNGSELSRVSNQITIVPGMSARQVSRLLKEAGIVDSSNRFERYLEQQALDTRIQSGVFTFDDTYTYEQIATMITTANSPTQTITVYDGLTLREIDSMLVQKNLGTNGAFVEAAETIIETNGLPFAEGWFLSGKYEIAGDYVPMELASTMHAACIKALQDNAASIELLDRPISDVVIVASMIQRETQNPVEMPVIADIMYRRLDMGMTLGIDATLRYFLDVWDRPLTEADLQTNSPYNTRKVKGLPPTGIGSIGIEALEAALSPQPSEWLYYLHDSTGQIHFAATFEEHKQNIERYL